MATKAQVYELAEKLGATIRDEGEFIGIEAPTGYLAIDDIHEYIIQYNPILAHRNRGQFWNEVFQDLKTMEREGFEKCQTKDCEWCEGTEAEASGDGIAELINELKMTRKQRLQHEGKK